MGRKFDEEGIEEDENDWEDEEEEEEEDERVVRERKEGVRRDPKAIARDIMRYSRYLLIFSFLTEPTRIADIVSESGIPRTAVSRVLHNLAGLGLVNVARGLDGRNTYYVLSSEGMNVLKELRDIVKKKLSKCIVKSSDIERKELNVDCTLEVLRKVSADRKVISALLLIGGVERVGDKFIINEK